MFEYLLISIWAIGCLFIFGLFFAPYWLAHQDLKNQNLKLKIELKKLEKNEKN